MKPLNSLNDLIDAIELLPNVKSVKVPTEPTGFYTGEKTIFSTENNWKQTIIKMVTKVANKSKKPIEIFRLHGYYGEEPKEGNEYYIQMLNADGIHTGKMLSSGAYGRLD